MFKNKSADGKNNICGEKLFLLRTSGNKKLSQRMVAERMQILGIDVDKNAIQRIESGQRFVTDIELKALCEIFGISCDEMLNNPKK